MQNGGVILSSSKPNDERSRHAILKDIGMAMRGGAGASPKKKSLCVDLVVAKQVGLEKKFFFSIQIHFFQHCTL